MLDGYWSQILAHCKVPRACASKRSSLRKPAQATCSSRKLQIAGLANIFSARSAVCHGQLNLFFWTYPPEVPPQKLFANASDMPTKINQPAALRTSQKVVSSTCCLSEADRKAKTSPSSSLNTQLPAHYFLRGFHVLNLGT